MSYPGTYTIIYREDEFFGCDYELVRVNYDTFDNIKYEPILAGVDKRDLLTQILLYDSTMMSLFYESYAHLHIREDNFHFPLHLYSLVNRIIEEKLTIDIY